MYHIEEIADAPFMWEEIELFARTESLEEVEARIMMMSIAPYERTFRVYHHHDASVEPIFQYVTKCGELLDQKLRFKDGKYEIVKRLYVGDRRTQYEIDADDAMWKKLHRDKKYGMTKADLSQWMQSEHKEDARIEAPKKYPLKFRQAAHKITAQSEFWAKRADRR